jgi:pyruvate kinase
LGKPSTQLILSRPATNSVTKIIQLFDAGMSVARFNMQHGTTKVRPQLMTSVAEQSNNQALL